MDHALAACRRVALSAPAVQPLVGMNGALNVMYGRIMSTPQLQMWEFYHHFHPTFERSERTTKHQYEHEMRWERILDAKHDTQLTSGAGRSTGC